MNHYKQLRKNRKKEELPSFLVGLTEAPEDISLAPKPHPSTHYLGPIFVGLCSNYQHHPPPHSLKLGSFHQPQFIMLPGADDISKLLYTQSKVDKITQTVHVKKREIKRPKIYHDIYPHKCTGSKRMFIPDITPHVIDLGKTPSIIEGETSFEIPVPRSHLPLRYRRKSLVKHENHFITLSDLREERRMFMSYKERIAHAHFPKEFATVRVIGPPIPASIIITKLPSKRRTESQINLETKAETQKLDVTEETEGAKGKSTKPKLRKTSKKSLTKSLDQSIESQERVDKETEIQGEDYEEYSAGEEEEEEEIYGEGFEELEGEKEESEEWEKEEGDEEDETIEEREEKTTIYKEEPTVEVKEEPKTEIEERRTLVKEDPKTEVKEPKTEIEKRKTIVIEGPNTEGKEEPKAGAKEELKVQIREEQKPEGKSDKKKSLQMKEEAVSEQRGKGTSVTSATYRKETDAKRISAVSATSRKDTDAKRVSALSATSRKDTDAKRVSALSGTSRKETDAGGERTTSKIKQDPAE